MEIKEQVLEAMKKANIPLNAGKIVELTLLDRKAVDKAMNILKEEGTIISPKRCFWLAK
ncbi:MAG: MarR family transcriptional regulator [Bacteroidales bacterium]